MLFLGGSIIPIREVKQWKELPGLADLEHGHYQPSSAGCRIRRVSLPFNSDRQDYHGTNWFSSNQLEHIELSWSIYFCLTFLFAFGGIWTCSLRRYPKQPQLYLPSYVLPSYYPLLKNPMIYSNPQQKPSWEPTFPLKSQFWVDDFPNFPFGGIWCSFPTGYPKQPRFAHVCPFFISSFRYAKYLSLESSGSSFWSTKNNFLGVLPWKLSVHSRRDFLLNTDISLRQGVPPRIEGM